ncbi:MAG: DUF6463 family protein [Erythrobacter sp.]
MAQKRWTGRAILIIAIIHTIFGLIGFGPALIDIASNGLFNGVGADPMRGAVVWFLFAGFFMFTTGLAVDKLEELGAATTLKKVGIALLVIIVLGVILMPISGFWLMFPPAIGLILKKEAG